MNTFCLFLQIFFCTGQYGDVFTFYGSSQQINNGKFYQFVTNIVCPYTFSIFSFPTRWNGTRLWNFHGMALKSIYTKTKITLHFTKLCFFANSKSKMADSGNIAYLTHKYFFLKNYWTHWSKCIADISINSLYSACPYHTHGLSHFGNTNLIAKSWFLFLSDTKFQDAIFSIAQCVGIRQ